MAILPPRRGTFRKKEFVSTQQPFIHTTMQPTGTYVSGGRKDDTII